MLGTCSTMPACTLYPVLPSFTLLLSTLLPATWYASPCWITPHLLFLCSAWYSWRRLCAGIFPQAWRGASGRRKTYLSGTAGVARLASFPCYARAVRPAHSVRAVEGRWRFTGADGLCGDNAAAAAAYCAAAATAYRRLKRLWPAVISFGWRGENGGAGYLPSHASRAPSQALPRKEASSCCDLARRLGRRGVCC